MQLRGANCRWINSGNIGLQKAQHSKNMTTLPDNESVHQHINSTVMSLNMGEKYMGNQNSIHIALSMTKAPYSFGHPEFNRLNHVFLL